MKLLSKLMGYGVARCSGCKRLHGDRFMYLGEAFTLYCGTCWLNPWLMERSR